MPWHSSANFVLFSTSGLGMLKSTSMFCIEYPVPPSHVICAQVFLYRRQTDDNTVKWMETQNEQMASREWKKQNICTSIHTARERERECKIKERSVIIKPSIDGWSLAQVKKQNVNHSNKHMLDEWRFIHCDIDVGSAQIENHEAVIRAMREKFVWKLNLVAASEGEKMTRRGWTGWMKFDVL